MNHKIRFWFTVTAVWASAITVTAQAQHAGDILVGRSSAGQLMIGPPGSGGYFPEANIKVLPAVSGVFNGWSDNNPGFDHLVIDQPGLDFYSLQNGTQVRLEVVANDPAFQAITGGLSVIETPGQRALLGNATLHTHLTWLIKSNHPAFDPMKVLWRATYRLVDTGATAYSASAPFTMYFANVACQRGDCNGDEEINGLDVADFVETVLNPAGASAEERCRADANRDGWANLEDVEPFVAKLVGA